MVNIAASAIGIFSRIFKPGQLLEGVVLLVLFPVFFGVLEYPQTEAKEINPMGYNASLNVVYGARLSDIFPEGARIQTSTVTKTDGWGKAIGQFNLEEAYLGAACIGDNKSGYGMRYNLYGVFGESQDIDDLNEKWLHYSNHDGKNLAEWLIGIELSTEGTENVITMPTVVSPAIVSEVQAFLRDRFQYSGETKSFAILHHSY